MTAPPAPALALLQGRSPQTAWDMILGGTPSTLIVLAVLTVFSVASWALIFWKWRQFRKVRKQGDRVLAALENAHGLQDAYKAIVAIPDSPYSRVFRRGVRFFNELRSGTAREGQHESGSQGLTPAQLEALRLVLEKEEAEERDELARGLTWLAIIGTVSPLLGLLGTVIGVMNAFLGITVVGSANITAVAPGIAEALIATVFGLAAAIPAVMAYNHFVARLNLVSAELEGFSSEFIATLAREGRV
ncbi:MAG: MotA/TolQ/ExbB proton channel family protein [Gemmatimonadetes bacterium]|nr:MotA/TolQ/ExbB proton channel family protein [Gemmatimonadota bacterium]